MTEGVTVTTERFVEGRVHDLETRIDLKLENLRGSRWQEDVLSARIKVLEMAYADRMAVGRVVAGILGFIAGAGGALAVMLIGRLWPGGTP